MQFLFSMKMDLCWLLGLLPSCRSCITFHRHDFTAIYFFNIVLLCGTHQSKAYTDNFAEA
ncbi:hypothetical protein O6H91_18G058500 [Diphasiastrum complanatum]|uniref:Uncharacterized protein n=1 Tax=Diphasiastrum complanatum TaxID=34168 RepID=A0ACC2B1V3_DIPCM|nr:hypothetical protein O6H91_18G058500 [Diphasiastrum complanatum]